MPDDAVNVTAERMGTEPALGVLLGGPRPAFHADALCRERPDLNFLPDQ